MERTVIIYLCTYILILFGMSWWVARGQGNEDFLIAGRNRPGWQILLSKFASAIGASYFITYTGFAYRYGIGVFVMLAGIVAGYLLFAYWAAPRIASGSRTGRWYTVGHFVREHVRSDTARKLVDGVSSLILFGWLVVGVIGSGKIISHFGIVPYPTAVLIVGAVVLGYLYLAGFRAVLLTDVVQSIIILVLMAVVTVGILDTTGAWGVAPFAYGSIDVGTAAGFFLFGVLSIFSYADRYQLSYAAGTEHGLRHGLGLAVLPIVAVTFLLFLIGVIMSEIAPGLDTGLVFTEALTRFLHPSLVPAALVLFFAGIMSSADTIIYAIASHLAFVYQTDDTRRLRVRTAIVLVTVCSVLAAFVFSDAVDASIMTAAASLTLSTAMMYVIAGGKSARRCIASIIGAAAGMAGAVAYWGLDPAAAPVIVLCGLAGLAVGEWGVPSNTNGKMGALKNIRVD